MATRLKSLELHGYKTFASRTKFEFPGNITAVVGPNGAGKSNVADSLRWVLGEQAYSLLRGRKTEDMIFSGSQLRSKSSMASASITFDNEDGWLPIDYSEVSLARRAYRDGQNEYLLNNQRVRLKETSELLAKSGLAERTYTIIGQGLVDAVLSLKPEERRKFFEEAAGIGLYRSRREEALNRLKSTQRNLERVQDIQSELKPRLRSLERQARRAKEYEQIKTDLQALLRQWYGYHWHRTQRELERAKVVLREQVRLATDARQKQSKVEQDIDTLRFRLQKLRSELGTWHSESAAIHQKREQRSRNLAVLEERQRALARQSSELEEELFRLSDEEKAQQERITQMTDETDQLRQELKEAEVQVQQANEQLRAQEDSRNAASQALKEARAQLLVNETHKVEFRAHYNELLNRVEALRQSFQALTETADGEAAALKRAEEAYDTISDKRNEIEIGVHEAEKSLKNQRQKIGTLEDKRTALNRERTQLEAERAKAQTQLQVLEQAEKSLSGLNQGAKTILEASSKGKLRGSYQAISHLLEVPAAYETAIASALGDFLDGVVLEPDANLEEVLDFLGKGEQGRAAILPPAKDVAAKKRKTIDEKGVIGNAAQLVKASRPLAMLIDVLLGTVFVVEDRATAKRIVSMLETGGRAVTLSGEVFWSNGAVVAGKDNRVTMISRPRQKRELQVKIEEVEQQLNRLMAQEDELESDIAEKQLKEKQQQIRLQENRNALNGVVREFQKSDLALEQARQRSAWQKNKLSETEANIEKAENEIRRLLDEQKSIEVEIADSQTLLRERNRDMMSLPLEELQSQMAHWKTNAAVAERAVVEAEKRFSEQCVVLDRNRQRRQLLVQRKTANQGLLAGLEAEKDGLRQQENELNAQIETLTAKIDPGERSLEELERDYSAVQDQQRTIHQETSVAERHEAHAQLDVTRKRESMTNLRSKIEDDLGLVNLNYRSDISGPNPLPLDIVKQLVPVEALSSDVDDEIKRQRALLRRLGAINPDAQEEYHSVQDRHDFLITQVDDLNKADADLREVIGELDILMKREFCKTFDAVAEEFKQIFRRLFGGGSAKLVLMDEENPIEAGIDIEARLPGRRTQGLALLSGGERSLTAVALIFSLLRVSPTPFCVLDEVDAALDEANVGRFCELLQELSKDTQFVVITHNRNTVQVADVIYGVTMGRDSASQVISLKLDELSDDMVR
ncbi:MAG: chromosome segregation protein SMC [Anaerolineaceae bacterium]|nr:chromosome segregation protein SMC [Anaerolineaceae bacterium]